MAHVPAGRGGGGFPGFIPLSKGFQLFMKTYLEVDIPEELCQHLFMSFKRKICQRSPEAPRPGASISQLNSLEPKSIDAGISIQTEVVCAPVTGSRSLEKRLPFGLRKNHNSLKMANVHPPALASQVAYLKDIVCYLSLLERGRAEDKLEFMFRLYDTDGNGVLDSSELDRIISQMVHVAEYLEWDSTELKPILKEMMEEIDFDHDGTVTLEEWIRGGMTTIPLLVLLGMETVSRRVWAETAAPSPGLRCFCHSKELGGYEQWKAKGKATHGTRTQCESTWVPKQVSCSSRMDLGQVMPHTWIEGNSPVKCDRCHKSIKCYQGITGLHCAWCQTSVSTRGDDAPQAGGAELLPSPGGADAGLGATSPGQGRGGSSRQRAHPAPTPESHWVALCSLAPSLARGIAPNSNLRLGVFLPGSPAQPGAPRKWSPVESAMHWMAESGAYVQRAMHAWSNASVRGVCVERAPSLKHAVCTWSNASVRGVCMERAMRWMAQPGEEGGSLLKVLKDVEHSTEVMLDRWRIDVIPADKEENGDPVPYSIINNYFSIGVVSGADKHAHACPRSVPWARMKNKLWYFEFGTTETFAATCKKLHEYLEVECDGTLLDLSSTSLEGIAVLNIPSMYGGSNLWGETKRQRSYNRMSKKVPEKLHSTVVTDAKELKFCVQDLSDQLLEVVGLEGAMEMGQIYTGLKSAGKRLAQCSSVTIRYRPACAHWESVPPRLPCVIKITHKSQVPMLLGPPQKSSFFFLRRRNRTRD
uniref:Diacylglycerol kinase gamma n=1 Tax=Pelodiscus sinensis TaxID=13735 RepID=K7GC36_PELSI